MKDTLKETMDRLDAEVAKRSDPNYYPESITDAWVLMLCGRWTQAQYDRYLELYDRGKEKGYRTEPEPVVPPDDPWWAWPLAILLMIAIAIGAALIWGAFDLPGQGGGRL